MENRWILNIEGFGKIESASIEMAPFTLFIGDNNSGKSYLLSLIWGFLCQNGRFMTSDINDDRFTLIYDALEKIFGSDFDIENIDLLISTEFADLLLEYINTSIMENLPFALYGIFNYGDITCEKIWISNIHKNNKERLIHAIKDYIDLIKQIRIMDKDDVDDIITRKTTIFMFNILTALLGFRKVVEDFFWDKSLYLPTARTGLVLTYKTLLREATNAKFNIDEVDKNLLTRPISEFLKTFTNISEKAINSKFVKIIDFIESMLIDGKIISNNLPLADIFYIPNNSEIKLPMFLSSSVVTELVPIILALKYNDNYNSIIIEEPEMCLHPRLQWLMARVLIRLVNNGLPVFVSTHSDIILQHINNMIKLKKNSNCANLMQKYSYTDDDLLNSDDVNIYQFDINGNHKTNITKLECGEFGFKAPTFNSMLIELLDQSRDFE